MGFQPSELCKVLMVLVLAHFLGHNESKMDSALPLLLSLGLVIVPVIGIYLQSDFGTAAILLVTWLGMLFAIVIKLSLVFTMLGIFIFAYFFSGNHLPFV